MYCAAAANGYNWHIPTKFMCESYTHRAALECFEIATIQNVRTDDMILLGGFGYIDIVFL